MPTGINGLTLTSDKQSLFQINTGLKISFRKTGKKKLTKLHNRCVDRAIISTIPVYDIILSSVLSIYVFIYIYIVDNTIISKFQGQENLIFFQILGNKYFK